MSSPGGKGSAPRPMQISPKTFEANFDAIFNSKKGTPESMATDTADRDILEKGISSDQCRSVTPGE